MNIDILETILNAERLHLERDGEFYRASSEHPLNLMVAAGGDTVRFTKIEAVDFSGALVDKGVCGLIRKDAYSIVEIESIFAVEREQPNELKEKRRTGFV